MNTLERLLIGWFFLRGIDRIAGYIGTDPGNMTEWGRELVDPPPIFKMNGTHTARKTDLRKWKKRNQKIIEAAKKPLPSGPTVQVKPRRRGRWK